MTPNPKTLLSLAALAMAALPCAASAQSWSNSAGQFYAGYGAARYTTARPVSGSTRDANGNRLVVDGLIQSGASTYSSASGGAATAYSGAGGNSSNGQTQIGGATAIGNSLNVVVQGNNNTVIVNSNQTNTGNVVAGTALNGTLRLQ